MIALVLAAGAVNWLATTIIVESELVRPVRDFVCRRRLDALERKSDLDVGAWRWLDYLLRCHLCAGVWVGVAEVAWLGDLVGHGFAGFVFSALLVKAVGHLILEARPQAWVGE